MMRGSAAFKIAPWPMGGGAQLSPSTLHSPLSTLQLHLAARAAASDKYRLAPRVTEPESGAEWTQPKSLHVTQLKHNIGIGTSHVLSE